MREHEASEPKELTELLPSEQVVLGALFHKHAGQPFSTMMTTAESAAEGLSGVEARSAFIRLRQKGWIRAVRKTWGESLYYIPVHQIPALTAAYAQRIMDNGLPERGMERDGLELKMTQNNPIQVIQEAKPDIAAEIIHILAWIAREDLSLTNKGTVHKRMLQRLSAMTHWCAEDFVGLNLQYEHLDVYPAHVAILLDMLLSLGLLHKDQGKIQVDAASLGYWLKQSWSFMHREIFKVCMDRYGISSPEAQHFRYRLILLGASHNTWFDIADVIPQRNKNEETGDAGQPEYVRSWLNALAGWGYGEIGEDAFGTLFYRWLIDPEALLHLEVQQAMDTRKNVFFVQPDFEIMVPPEVTPQVRWKLEYCAELISLDRMSIYRVTKEQIMNASRNGFTCDKVMEFLDRYAATRVPEHVRMAIQQWGSEWDRLKMQSDKDAAKNQIIKPIDFFFMEKSEKDKSDKDEHMIEPGDSQESFYVQGREGLVHLGADSFISEPEQSVVEASDLLPEYGSIPDMWHNDWRRYHMSTTRQITATAIEWQTKLGLKKEQSVVYIIPDQIQGHDDWTLTGWVVPGTGERAIERCTISPMDWDKIRLIVPEQI
ncbi:helicase-associated domain-containing protein [Paenibacillus xylanilyticus]|uniref:helicase-associated domain-containing protein n=1 Tax=Paenibacillus xylanilyticus TaxID=248903 RepID=UPI00399F69FD